MTGRGNSQEIYPATFVTSMLISQESEDTAILQVSIDGRGAALLINHVLTFGTAKALHPCVHKWVVKFSGDGEGAEAHEAGQVAPHFEIAKVSRDGYFWASAQQMTQRLPVFAEDNVLAPVGQVQTTLRPGDFTYHQK